MLKHCVIMYAITLKWLKCTYVRMYMNLETECTGMNYIPPKFMCLSPNPQYLTGK